MFDVQLDPSMTKSCPKSDDLTFNKRLRAALSDVSHFNLMESLSSSISFPANSPRSSRLVKKCSKSKGARKATYKHVPHSEKPAHLVARRNERERRRVQAVNSAFLQLRKHVPHEPKHKRLSKFKTLKVAIQYIRHLQDMIESHDDKMSDKQHKRATRCRRDYSHSHHLSPRTCLHRPYRSSLPPCSHPSCNLDSNPLATKDDSIALDSHGFAACFDADEHCNTAPTNLQASDVWHRHDTNPYNEDFHQSRDSSSNPFDGAHAQDSLHVHQQIWANRARLPSNTLFSSQGTSQTFPEGAFHFETPPVQNHPANQWHPLSAMDSSTPVYRPSGVLAFPDTRSHSATPDSVASSLDSWNNNSNHSGIPSNVAYSSFQDYAGVRSNDTLSTFTRFST